MKIEDKIYVFLCALFAIISVIGNMIYQKFVTFSIPSIHTFELSVGVIFYPLTFLITDLIAEFYGKEKSSFCVKISITMSIIATSIIFFVDSLEAVSWSKINQETFHKMFGMYHIAFLGSILACWISQSLDIRLYLWIKQITGDKYLWLRNNVSTATSLLVDTSVVIGFMTICGVLPQENMLSLISNSYLFKFLFTICSTPLFYSGVWVIRSLKNAQGDL